MIETGIKTGIKVNGPAAFPSTEILGKGNMI